MDTDELMTDAGSYEDYLAAVRGEERRNRAAFTGTEPLAPHEIGGHATYAPAQLQFGAAVGGKVLDAAAWYAEFGRQVDALVGQFEEFAGILAPGPKPSWKRHLKPAVASAPPVVAVEPEPPKRGQRLTELRASVERRGHGRQWWLR